MNALTTFAANRILPIYLALCLILGGASAAGIAANTLLQLLAVAIIVAMLWRRTSIADTPNAPLDVSLLYWIIAISAGWVAVQLTPLPPAIWQNLPGRDFVTAGDAMLGMTDVWRPISLQPSRTLISAMGLLPPVAILLLTLRSTAKAREYTIWMIVAIAALSAVLGVIQIFQPTQGGAYFYAITNYGASVGFFSNANHLATLLLIALVFSSELPFGRAASRKDKSVLWRLMKWGLVGFFAINIVVNGSVAGIGLLVAALAYVAIRQDYLRTMIGGSKVAIGAIAGVVALAAGTFFWKFSGHLSTFAETSVEGEDRLEFATNTIRMIADSFPFGYGLGSFRDTYLGYENLRTVTMTFVNHAHNDYLEIVADFGLVAIAALAIFALWFARRLGWMWQTRVSLQPYCYAAAMTIVLAAAHSIVDYPLRTSAIAAIFAFAAGCLAYPVVEQDVRRHRSRRARAGGSGRSHGTGHRDRPR